MLDLKLKPGDSVVIPPEAPEVSETMNHDSNDTQQNKLTGEELAKHDSKESCWVSIDHVELCHASHNDMKHVN